MAVEAPVLDGDEGGRGFGAQPGNVDRRFLDRPAAGNRMAVVESISSAGSSSGSSARDKGAVTISHNKVTKTIAASE